MSRISIRTFVLNAKTRLQQALRANGSVSFVIGNESADLDSITSALVYGYLQSSTAQAMAANRYVFPVTNIPASDLTLRPELTALLAHADLKPSDLITLDDLGKIPLPLEKSDWILVDHNALQAEIGKYYSQSVSGVIDHHADENKVPRNVQPRIIETTGSCASLVVNQCRSAWDDLASYSTTIGASHGQDDRLIDDFAYTSTWDAQVAKLALGAILIDTINMKEEHKIRDHDRKAVRYLEARINISPKLGKNYDRDRFFDEINAAKSNLDSLSLDDILRKDYKQWSEGDLKLGISSSVQLLEYLETKTDDFMAELINFGQERNLQLFAIMTAFNSDSGEFSRELLLICLDEGKATEAAQKFTETYSEKLQLSSKQLKSMENNQTHGSSGLWIRVWDQKDLTASRKQVGPMLRESMKRICE